MPESGSVWRIRRLNATSDKPGIKRVWIDERQVVMLDIADPFRAGKDADLANDALTVHQDKQDLVPLPPIHASCTRNSVRQDSDDGPDSVCVSLVEQHAGAVRRA